ncbi:DNA-directed RNA polymerase [Spironucleus salmonicida]|uniref:DNA-directed RNA polymerase n=1 Tax=Spironucleus salmonicida TaxID=348837 RepID=V6LT78_9EUKA|nr:DNA-directed RNA polymerase [Spironucleus salmonicida]KAH0574286.1 DNA-directed RNA polymerase [Spironucleus salmonicida]|eukprot:EST47852.1 DNA-directed RNA polymerase [Spironucleus salmonicida]
MLIQFTSTHQINLQANLLNIPFKEAVEISLRQQFTGRQLDKQGICVAISKVISYTQPKILQNMGNLSLEATFEAIVFRPFRGERIWAQVEQQNLSQIQLSTPFGSVVVARLNLFEGSEFDGQEWIWRFQGVENYIQNGNTCFVRVIDVKVNGEGIEIQASMDEPGLGDLRWWR